MSLDTKSPPESQCQQTVLTDLVCLTPDEKFLKLYSVKWQRGDKSGMWTFASRRKEPECFHGHKKPDAVVVVPFYEFDDGRFGMVITKEFRIPLGAYYYGFPAGLIDEGETPELAAIREMKEETGLDVIAINQVSPPLYSSAGMTDENAVLVFCSVKGTISKEGCEAAEDIETLMLDFVELEKLSRQAEPYQEARLSTKMWPILNETLRRM